MKVFTSNTKTLQMKKIPILNAFLILLLLTSCSTLYPTWPSDSVKKVDFENKPVNAMLTFQYADTTKNTYLKNLRTNYGLDTIVSPYTNEIDKIKAILDWTHKQWVHNGSNTPSSSDPLTISQEAKDGKSFRCVEYGIVSSAALSSLGIPSRVLSLKTVDVKRVKYGAGHVAAEAYSKELKKWIFIDGQFNAIPVLNNVPLNAVEFQKAITEKKDALKIVNKYGELSKEEHEEYINWIGKYLYFMDINFNNRHEFSGNQLLVDGKKSLMVVPVKAKHPTVFQRKYPIDYCLYTNNVHDFYQKPN